MSGPPPRPAGGPPRRPAAGPVQSLTLADLDYDLPADLVAQTPVVPRDSSRLLLARRGDDVLEDRVFHDLPELLHTGDVLVRNDTRVFPARSFFRRATGGRIEVLFLRPAAHPPAGAGAADAVAGVELWEVLLRGRPRPGEVLTSEALEAAWPITCREPFGDGRWLVESGPGASVFERLEEAGLTPLPPYIHERLDDPERYQTTYARALGSAAAPTAGLHFTPELDAALERAGIGVETVTLHVGLGTFKPLQEDGLQRGRLHRESYAVDAAVWARLCSARAAGRRVIAVGTTSLRTLEHLALAEGTAAPHGGGGVAVPAAVLAAAPAAVPGAAVPAPPGGVLRGDTDLFIAPGFEFRAVDGLLTNFHLPRTSLLALVMAFYGVDATRRLYAHAVAARYRFYSFGDAMLVL